MTPVPLWAALVAATVLALVHAVTPSLRFLEGTPRSVWLSIAGGVSVAYVFVHLLPELAAGEAHFRDAVGSARTEAAGFSFAERHVYLVALLGLATFYGLQRLASASREAPAAGAPRPGDGRDSAATDRATSPGVFWVHIASFGFYNALVGYLLLHLERRTLGALAFFAVAMALHFVVTDFGLNEDHKARYRRAGRWVLAAAVLAGFALGAVTELSALAVAVLVAFLAGGVILNVLKEEVPTERRSRFWAFALGMAGYAALLLTL
jgi:hypothetical protein